MKRKVERVWRGILAWGGLLAVGVADEPLLEASWGELHGEPLVPAVLGMWTDQTGSAWNVQDHGILARIGSGMINAGQSLWIDGEAFASGEPLMTREGGEWVFPADRLHSGLAVTRRVRLDLETGVIRYLEMLSNPTGDEAVVTVEVRSQFNGNHDEIRADSGRLSPTVLESGETGLVVRPASTSHPHLLLHALRSGDDSLRPAVSAPNRYAIHVRFTVRVPPGKTALLLHAMAQRIPDQGGLPSEGQGMASLRLEELAANLPRAEREALANVRMDGEGGGGICRGFETDLRAAWGRIPDRDELWLAGETVLPGEITGGPIRLRTEWGLLDVPVEDVVTIVGRSGSDPGGVRLFLRSGESWLGEWDAVDLAFLPGSGAGGSIPLAGGRFERLVRGGGGTGIAWPDGAEGFIETREGERIAVTGLRDHPVGLAASWGAWQEPLSGIAGFAWLDGDAWWEGRDGSRFRALPADETWMVRSLRFGEIRLPVKRVRRFVHRDQTGGTSGEGNGSVVVRLNRDERIVGTWADDAVEVISGEATLALRPDAIRWLRSEGDANRVRIALRDGGIVAGEWRNGSVRVSGPGGIREIPVEGILEVVVRGDGLTAEERKVLEAEIARLGADSWAEREAASERLAQLGDRAREDLRSAWEGAGDPEIKHRLHRLLDRLPEPD